MKRVSSFSVAVALCVSCTVCGQDAPLGIPPMIVKDVDGLPVACLPSGEAPVPLHSVMVGTLNADWPPAEWAIVLQDHAKPVVLRAGECVTYRQTLPGYKQVGADQPLRAGETYGFGIRRTNSSAHWAEGFYLGVFCVDQRPGGSRRYLPYVQHEDGSGTYPSCGRYIGWKPAADGIIPPGYLETMRRRGG